MTQKLYCYVDETGQDTQGRLFVVAAVIVASDRESERQLLRQIERASGKGRKKWTKATREQRRSYAGQLVEKSAFKGQLLFARFEMTSDYLSCVFNTIAWALAQAAGKDPYLATILIDGLGKAEYHRAGSELRSRGVVMKKVRGLKDETDEFIRLADAVCGLIRDEVDGDADLGRLYQQGVNNQVIQEIGARKNPRG
jgi:hypothetical protein